MSEELVVKVEGVTKKYRLGVIRGATLVDDLRLAWGRLRGRTAHLAPIELHGGARTEGDTFWALRGVTFELRKGEVLGIVGRNGAGKSTLLKLLSRITLPTEGRIRMKGRVSSLLEVGTGFNNELTGRENIYLNGAILGMRRAEIDRKLDDIISFSGIEHHIDTPVKRYSSGMKVRLGFAVAAHLEPEILIIDEVLAVGDADFQRKCLGKIRDVSGSGRTILFVSHNMAAVKTLCSRVIWLEDGRVRADGPTDAVVQEYMGASVKHKLEMEWSSTEAPGVSGARLRRVAIQQDHTGNLTWRDPFRIAIDVENTDFDPEELTVGMQLYNEEDVMAFASSIREKPGITLPHGRSRVQVHIPGELLNIGDYRITINVFLSGRKLFSVDEAIAFHVHDTERTSTWFGRSKGVFRPVLHWSMAPIPETGG